MFFSYYSISNSFSSFEKVIDNSLESTLVVGTLYSHVPSSLVVKVSFIGVVGSGMVGGLFITSAALGVVTFEIKLAISEGVGFAGDEIILTVAPGSGVPVSSRTTPDIVV